MAKIKSKSSVLKFFHKSARDFNQIQFFLEIELDELMFYLGEINRHVELKISDASSLKNDELDNEEKLQLAYHYQGQPHIILCESIIISLATILERFIDVFCEACMVHRNIELSYKNLKGSMLSQFKTYMKKVINLNIPFEKSIWADINSVYEIRNNLVHRGGNLPEEKRKTIEAFVRRKSSFAISEGNYIEVTANSCKEAASIIKEFFQVIIQVANKELIER